LADDLLPVAMDDELLAVSQRPIGNASRLVKSDFTINGFRLGMVRLEMNRKREWDQPKPIPPALVR
jgi:hypothetical protein